MLSLPGVRHRRHGGGFVYVGTTTAARGATVQRDATFDLPQWRLRVTRHYLAASASPTFETWTTFTPLGFVPVVSDLNAFRFTVPNGHLRWVNGLRGETTDRAGSNTFTMRELDLQAGEHLSLGATGRSSETTVPWLSIEARSEVFYPGLLWSGAWTLQAARSGSARLRLRSCHDRQQHPAGGGAGRHRGNRRRRPPDYRSRTKSGQAHARTPGDNARVSTGVFGGWCTTDISMRTIRGDRFLMAVASRCIDSQFCHPAPNAPARGFPGRVDSRGLLLMAVCPGRRRHHGGHRTAMTHQRCGEGSPCEGPHARGVDADDTSA